MRYEIRFAVPSDPSPYRFDRWVIHAAGRPDAVVGYALTKRGALRAARQMAKQYARGSRSYPA